MYVYSSFCPEDVLGKQEGVIRGENLFSVHCYDREEETDRIRCRMYMQVDLKFSILKPVIMMLPATLKDWFGYFSRYLEKKHKLEQSTAENVDQSS